MSMPTEMTEMYAFAKPILDLFKGFDDALYDFGIENELNPVEQHALSAMLSGELGCNIASANIRMRLKHNKENRNG